MAETPLFIPARLKSAVVGGHVAGTADILDDTRSKTQAVINQETEDTLEALQGSITENSTAIATNTTAIATEQSRAEAAEKINADNITQEEARAKAREDTLEDNIALKADKSTAVTNVAYDATTTELRKTINGTTTKICNIVQSGYWPAFNSTTGIVSMTPIGGATIAPNAATGLIAMTF